MPEQLDIFGNVARTASLGQFADGGHRGFDLEIEEQTLAGMEGELLPTRSVFAQILEFFADNLAILVSHVRLLGRGVDES
ncbi:hypothetical protein PUN4_500019 [Paraburkholderia unamae]|nr:hypothetical protein PUN4_500019 [Paraburkholderia unamae]